MQIGDIKLQEGAAFAPMAGVSDAAMRRLCARYGAIYTVSEMVSTKALVMKDQKSRQLLLGDNGPAPYGVQLFGCEPEIMGQAVQSIEDISFDFLDINMGCPAPKIVGNGSGSALLKTPALAGEVAKAAVRASKRPVTVKMRIGWDDSTLTGVEVAKRCEDAGVELLVVHGRTREQQYSPGVRYDEVAKIKQAVSIPVLYNGDVVDAESALYAARQTGCDGVMVGRGAMGHPWVFREIAATLQGAEIPQAPSLRESMSVMEEQIRNMCEEKGEGVAMRQARGVAAAYMRGLRGAAHLRKQAVSLLYFTDVAVLIEEVYRQQEL